MEGGREWEDAREVLTARAFYARTRESNSYSSRMCEFLEEVERGAQYFRQHPIATPYKPGILGPPDTWEVFRRQAEAIRYADTHEKGLLVFAFEGKGVGSSGKRHFLATHPDHMWFRQNDLLPESRCMYEVIKADSPCKLYFDLEYMDAWNPGRNGAAMTATFVQIVCFFIRQEFGVACTSRDVINLRGTSCLKFSRHLIFNNMVFANNEHAGAFVRMVCGKIRRWKDMKENVEVPGVGIEDIKELFILDHKGSEKIFCDESVYTKNRNFRLYLSTKLGQDAPLVIANENEYTPRVKSQISTEKQLFFDSLVTLVEDSCTVLRYEDKEQLQVERVARQRGSRATSGISGNKKSPYPEIDNFICSLVHPGNIHSWQYFPETENIVYSIVNYRYCHHIQREHRSNRIMYVVNLKGRSYYQKCYDPDCKDFRSQFWDLPKELVFWANMDEVKEWVCLEGDGEDVSGGCKTDDVASDGVTVQSSNQCEVECVWQGATTSMNQLSTQGNATSAGNAMDANICSVDMEEGHSGYNHYRRGRNARGINVGEPSTCDLEVQPLPERNGNNTETDLFPQTQDYNTLPQTQNYDTFPQTQNDNTLPQTQNDNTLPQTQNYDTLPQTQNDNTLPQTQNDNTLPQTQNYDTLPQTQNDNTLPKTQACDTFPPPQIYNTLPQTQNYDTFPPPQIYNTLPQTQNYDTLPQTQIYNTLPQTQNDNTLPQTQNDNTLPQTQNDNTLPQTQACDTFPPPQIYNILRLTFSQTQNSEDPMYKWYHMEELIKSQSSQCLSDRLSQVPQNASQEDPQPSQSTDADHQNMTGSLSDEELLKAVMDTEELLLCAEPDMELTC